MTVDLRSLTWSAGALGSAVLGVAREIGMTAAGEDVPAELGETALGDAELAAWLRSCGARAGLGVELADCGYAELERTLGALGPAIVRLELEGVPRYLAVVASTPRACSVLTPARERAPVPCGELVRALTAALQREAAAPVDAWLRALAVPARRARQARRKLFESLLEERRLGPFFLLCPDPGTPFTRQLRQRGLLRLCLVLVALSAAHVALSLASWAVLGRTALSGYVEPGWISAWLLLQLGAVPFQLAIVWFGGGLLAETAVLLKRRLLAGALRIDTDRIRTRGAGRLLAMVFESEALETAGLAGAFGMLLALLQLASAVLVLAAGLGGSLEVLLLLAWSACCAWLVLRQIRGRSLWTRERFALARAFVESVVGNRTRVAQQPEPRWHRLEDRALEAHLDVARDMDDAQTRLMVLPARGWLVIGLAGLIPALVGGSPAPGGLVITLGGILQAYGALAALCGSAVTITGAAVAWREVRELFQAAAAAGNPGRAIFSSRREARDLVPAGGPPLLDAHGLSFQYPGRREPVLAECSLSLHAGDRVLLEGSSGAGKSTLAALLAGLRRPGSGHIAIAGLDRATLGDAGWRQRITSAPQFHENHILSASFAFNLLMGRSWPPSDADLREAADVCARLGLDALLGRMPSGMHQAIGETGWQLSHGERSRLFLARALLQDTDVLILDESFGALDPETLRRCLDLVLERARTLVVIAHP